MNICFIGDIVAAPGRSAIRNALPGFLRSNDIDLCIANGENAAHGLGCSLKIVNEITECGVDIVTLGNHSFSNYEFLSQIGKLNNVVKPSNVSSAWPGNDIAYFEKNGQRAAVINLMGQFQMNPCCNDPFTRADQLIEEIRGEGVKTIIVDFHAEATGEKLAMGHYLDGRVSLVVGTHTHVQTADERILKGGTGYITDAGMTGCTDSVLGMDIETSLRRLRDKIPARYEPAIGDGSINGIIVNVDNDGKCKGIRRFTEYE